MINKRLITLLVLITSIFILTGCGPAFVTKGVEFPKMYEQQPRSILILPPMNESTDAEAKDYYMTTIEKPFALAGYYTFPTEMVSDIMKQEGVYDTEVLYDLPLSKFDEYFGADAVLFTRIKKWDVSYIVITSTLTISIESILRSTKTSQELWKYTGTVNIDLTRGTDNIFAKIIVAAINTAMVDYVDHAHTANKIIVNTIPAGPYHGIYMKDQNIQLLDQTPQKEL